VGAEGTANPSRVPIPDVVDPEARGILLSLFAMGGEESVLERLDEKRRAVCARAWQELRGASEMARVRVLAEWRAEAASTLPQGLERLHPSWIEAALTGEPAHLVCLVLPDLPETSRSTVLGMLGIAGPDAQASKRIEGCPAAIRREVERVAFGWLAPLCEGACGPLAESLCGLAFDELLSEVTRRGARTVGQSLAGSAPALRARAMAAAGEPWAKAIGNASTESVSDADRKIAVAHANTRIPDSARTPSERLLHIGLAVLKSELAAEPTGSIYRVAGRLPATLGRFMIGW
jgi:hypothetical protein